MNRIERRIRAAVNPVSTGVTRWWCHSATRYMLTGHRPTARQRLPVRRGMARSVSFTPTARLTKARAAAIDDLMAGNTLDDDR